MAGLIHKAGMALERAFPERRVFLRSDTETRFLRLSPATQFFGIAGSALVVGWTIIASAFILMDSVGSGSFRDQARREQALYESRLNEMSDERDARAREALAAQDRFNAALAQVSEMQSALLQSEDRKRELEQGVEATQATLRKVIAERDAARADARMLTAKLHGDGKGMDPQARIASYESTLDMLTGALDDVAVERDMLGEAATSAEAAVDRMALEAKLAAQKNDRVLSAIEDAVTVSLEPLDKMFRSAGMSVDSVLATIKKGYSGFGGPGSIHVSTKGGDLDGSDDRAQAILDQLDKMNMYRIAAEKAPFSMPLHTAFRYTSPFGRRWGKMHEGVDLAGATGSPILSTADGTVIRAGTVSGYGNLVEVQHSFGITTRYGHLSKIRVKVGQKVSRGDQLGDMGNTGHSTGTHLHYEVRIGGTPIDPMTYIKAGKNVF